MAKQPPDPTQTDADRNGGTSPEPQKPANTRIARATGAKSEPLQNRLLNQAVNASRLPQGQQEVEGMIATLAALEAVAPTDAVEGMLAAQMIGTHEAAMECLRRAMIPDQTFEGRDANLKHAAKLTQIYARQMEALDKHRGRGQQKITVEHVTVQAGGQAIVGNVQSPATPERKAATAPLALSDGTGDLVHLPDPLTEASRIKQPVQRKSR